MIQIHEDTHHTFNFTNSDQAKRLLKKTCQVERTISLVDPISGVGYLHTKAKFIYTMNLGTK